MDKPEQIEAVARAICISEMGQPDVEVLPGTPHWVAYLDQAAAAIEAMTPSITGEDEELIEAVDRLREDLERPDFEGTIEVSADDLRIVLERQALTGKV